MGPKDFYTTFKIDGRDVAAVYTLRPEQQREAFRRHTHRTVPQSLSRPVPLRGRRQCPRSRPQHKDSSASGGWPSMWRFACHMEKTAPARTASVLKAYPVHSVWLT